MSERKENGEQQQKNIMQIQWHFVIIINIIIIVVFFYNRIVKKNRLLFCVFVYWSSELFHLNNPQNRNKNRASISHKVFRASSGGECATWYTCQTNIYYRLLHTIFYVYMLSAPAERGSSETEFSVRRKQTSDGISIE